MTDWDMDVLAREDLTPLEKLVYHLPWYEKGVSDLAKIIGVQRSYVARVVSGLVKKGLVNQVRRGNYLPESLPGKRILGDTPVSPEIRIPQDTCVSPKIQTPPENVSPKIQPAPNININKVIKYFNILEYRIEDENDRKRYNRCLEWLAKELTEECTSPDLLHRASLAFTHAMVMTQEQTSWNTITVTISPIFLGKTWAKCVVISCHFVS